MVNRPGPPTNRAATLGSGQYVMAVTALRSKIDLASFDCPASTIRGNFSATASSLVGKIATLNP
jgi:hypothetical protein